MHPTRKRAHSAASILGFALLATTTLHAQVQAPPHHLEVVQLQSGSHDNPQPIAGVVWSQFVFLPPETPWLRILFHDASLDKGSHLRMTSVLDGATMLMHQEHLAQWDNSSAFFNGNSVLIELVAGPNTTGNRVEIQQIMAGEVEPLVPETICGSTDDRVPSTDPRAGRISPIGCTGWIINVPAGGIDKAHLSAGHCFGTGQVLQFAVPASSSNCALVFPPPSKQFAIDSASSQSANTGIGNDWWVYRCFPNSTTGLTSFQEQGAAFDLAAVLPAATSTLRNFGYGLDGTNTNGASGGNGSCSCSSGAGTGTRNQTQQTHTGPLASVAGNRLNYAFDTCGGNSGSPVVNESTGQAIGIHTNGGCTSTGGNNSGTSILNAGLQAAIIAVAPAGVANDNCANALAIEVGVNGPFQNALATLSTPAWTCGGTNVGRDVWFRFDASCDGSHTFSTCTATRNFDTVLQVFSGTCAGLVLVGCNDDGCALGSSLTVNLSAGIHHIRVGGFNQQSGNFDVVVTRPTAYDAGPIITSDTGGSGGAPVSILQTVAPISLTLFGFTGNQSTFSVADDFVTNGAWCINAIELFAYQTGTLTPSLTGVFLEVYNGDPRTGGTPVAGSPGFTNNLATTAGYTVLNTMTGAFRAGESAPTDGTRPIQSVLVTLANPLNLNSGSIAGGRYFLRWTFTGTGASGPFVPPITVLGSRTTGNAIQATAAGVWSDALSGGVGQGMPFKLYGTTTAQPGAFTNLGGGCSPASLELRGAPHVGGIVQVDIVNPTPGTIPLIILGFADPSAPLLPSCTCVQHATLDVVSVGASYNWQVPTIPSGVGFELYVQGDQVFGAGLACDIGIGFRFELTDGYRIRLW